jgi:predicted transcriptional regulator
MNSRRAYDQNRDELYAAAERIAKRRTRMSFIAAMVAALLTVALLSLLGYGVYRELQTQNESVQAQNERLERLVLAAQEDREARTEQTRRLLARFNHEQEREDQRNRRLLVTLRRAVRNNVDRINALIRAILRSSPEGREILQEIRERQGDAEPPSQQ